MCYPVCGMVHIKEPFLLIDKSSLCGGTEFPVSLSLTICLTPYNRRLNVLSASLNKTFLSLSLKQYKANRLAIFSMLLFNNSINFYILGYNVSKDMYMGQTTLQIMHLRFSSVLGLGFTHLPVY